jgi:hypothetical protein
MSIADVYLLLIMPCLLWKAIAILRRTNDTISLCALLNAGEEYANNKDYNNAIQQIKHFIQKLNYEIGTAYNIEIGNALCRNWTRQKTMNQIN